MQFFKKKKQNCLQIVTVDTLTVRILTDRRRFYKLFSLIIYLFTMYIAIFILACIVIYYTDLKFATFFQHPVMTSRFYFIVSLILQQSCVFKIDNKRFELKRLFGTSNKPTQCIKYMVKYCVLLEILHFRSYMENILFYIAYTLQFT